MLSAPAWLVPWTVAPRTLCMAWSGSRASWHALRLPLLLLVLRSLRCWLLAAGSEWHCWALRGARLAFVMPRVVVVRSTLCRVTLASSQHRRPAIVVALTSAWIMEDGLRRSAHAIAGAVGRLFRCFGLFCTLRQGLKMKGRCLRSAAKWRVCSRKFAE